MKNLRLKAARAAKDLSQEQLALKCGVSRRDLQGAGQNAGRTVLGRIKSVLMPFRHGHIFSEPMVGLRAHETDRERRNEKCDIMASKAVLRGG